MKKPAKHSIQFIAVMALFLLSGLSSLIYQVIWTRMLVFVFGSTQFATSTVLAVFMGGLALGSYLAGRIADKTKRPFLSYGILEGLIGLWALAAPFLFALAIPIYQACFHALHEQPILFGLVRFFVALLILLPPTACMGATLPLLSRFVADNLESIGDRIGKLYAFNTLGAVLGAIAGGFFLLPAYGLNTTLLIAAFINFFLSAASYFLTRRWQLSSSSASEAQSLAACSESIQDSNSKSELANSFVSGQDSASAASEESAKLSKVTMATMITFAVSGGLAMVYEVAWTRSLLMVIGSTTYAFSVMLSTFLIGIFLGSYLCARFVDRLKQPIVWYAMAQLYLCLASFLAIVFFSFLPYLNLCIGFYYGQFPTATMFFRFAAAGAIMIPLTIGLGAIFPLAVKICTRELESVGSSVGKLYSVNTLGAIIGAFLSGFMIIPVLGCEQSLIFSAIANFVLGLVLMLIFAPMRSTIKGLAVLATAGLFFWAVQKSPIWNQSMVTFAQAERRRILISGENAKLPSLSEWKEGLEKEKTPFYKDGICANVAISVLENPPSVCLLTNGHPDASDYADLENQAMPAILPLLLKPNAKNVCIVGWGSGVTVGFALLFPIQKLICAEIEPVVVETSRFFHHVNYKPELDKRTIIEPSDGRNYLLCTPDKFDLIVSEPSNPWQAGVCNLFTREYFQVCRNRLNDDGLFTMWSQLNEVPTKNLKEVLAALRSVFPYVMVFDSGRGNICAVASIKEICVDHDQLQKTLADQKFRVAFSPFRLFNANDYVSRIRISPEGITQALNGHNVNSDDTNHLEYDVAKTYENQLFRESNWKWITENFGPVWDFVAWPNKGAKFISELMIQISELCANKDFPLAVAWAEKSNSLSANAFPLKLKAMGALRAADYEASARILSEGKTKFPNDAGLYDLEGAMYVSLKNFAKAREAFQKAISLAPTQQAFKYHLAQTFSTVRTDDQFVFRAYPAADPEQVISLCAPLAKDKAFLASNSGVLTILGDAYCKAGKIAEAQEVLKEAIIRRPADYLPWRLLSYTYAKSGEGAKADYCFAKAASLATLRLNDLLMQAKWAYEHEEDGKCVAICQRALEIDPGNKVCMSILQDLSKKDKNAQELYNKMPTENPFGNQTASDISVSLSGSTEPDAATSAGKK